MSLFGNIFGRSDPKSDNRISDPRARELEMISKLKTIDITDPHRQLSDEKILELKIPAVIEDACKELRYPLVIDQDITHLDDDLACIISALGEAVRLGQEMTAEWACNALTFAIRNLRTGISDMDEELAAETMRCRLEYSRNLKLLVQLCREYDNLRTSLDRRTRMRQQKRQELDEAKQQYMSRRNTGMLNHLLDELRLNVHAPASLHDDVRELRDELSRLHLLKASIIELDISIDADQIALNNRTAQINSRRNALASAPRARDPKLQDRINEADRLYREQLSRELNEAEESIRAYAEHIDIMTSLAQQSVNLTTISKALEEREQQSVNRLRQQLYEPAT